MHKKSLSTQYFPSINSNTSQSKITYTQIGKNTQSQFQSPRVYTEVEYSYTGRAQDNAGQSTYSEFFNGNKKIKNNLKIRDNYQVRSNFTDDSKNKINVSIYSSHRNRSIRSPEIFSRQGGPRIDKQTTLQYFNNQLDNKKRLKELEDQKQEIDEDHGFFRNIINDSSREGKRFDTEVPDVFDKNSIHIFYDHHKHLDSIIDQNKNYNITETPYTAILKNCKKQNVIPSKLGLIKSEGKDDSLIIRNMRFGDKYMKVLGYGIQNVASIKNYELSNNRITNKGSNALLKEVLNKAVKLDLSNNKIGLKGINNIIQSFLSQKCQLQHLNLENNSLGSQLVKQLLVSITSRTSSLKYLNLSKNLLDDQIIDSLKGCIESGDLNEIYLHWNNLKSQSGKIIFELLKEHQDSLKVLDLSNNCLGVQSKPGINFTIAFCEFLEKNKDLMHLDLSFNQINFEDSKKIAISLEKNKTLFGFHFSGNHGYMDSNGNLIAYEFLGEIQSTQIKKRIDGFNVVCTKNNNGLRENKIDICWICEGWNQATFKWTQFSGPEYDNQHLFIHFNFQDYQGQYLGENFKSFQKMIPPNDVYFFFSNNQEQFFTARDADSAPNNHKKLTIHNVQTQSGHQKVVLNELNQIRTKTNYKLIQFFQWQVEILPRIQQKIYVEEQKKKIKKIWSFPNSIFSNWQIDSSELINLCFEYDWECCKVYKFIKDSSDLLKVKEFFRQRYKYIKDTYKHYSSQNPIKDVWAIQQLQFNELFVDKCKVIDHRFTSLDLNMKWVTVIQSAKGVQHEPASIVLNNNEKKQKITDWIDIHEVFALDIKESNTAQQIKENMIDQDDECEELTEQEIIRYQEKKLPRQSMRFSVNTMKSIQNTLNILAELPQYSQKNDNNKDDDELIIGKNPRNPENALNRYQMMEIIVKIVEEKYLNQKQSKANSYFEALQICWDEHLLLEFTLHDKQGWRELRYWSEECDFVLKYYSRILDYIYKKNSRKKVKPGDPPSMCLDELMGIVNFCQLQNEEHFGNAVSCMSFNLSMMNQVDELTNDRIFQMKQVEFYECIARIAEEACLSPLPGIYDEYEEWTLKKRIGLPLHLKLESLIQKMFKMLCDTNFQQMFPFQPNSCFWIDPEKKNQEMD